MDATASTGLRRTLKLLDLKPERRATARIQWPNPQDSIGILYRKIGSYTFWEARGEARKQYLCLAKDIKEHLEKHGDVVTASVFWLVYMVGKSETKANPTVFFCSKDLSARKQVVREIEGSRILDHFPGFNLGDSNQPPHLEHLKQLAVGDEGEPKGDQDFVHHNPIGSRILVRNGGSTVPATIGVVLKSGEDLFFTTAVHAFRDDSVNTAFPEDETNELDFEIIDDYESSSDLGDGSPTLQCTTDPTRIAGRWIPDHAEQVASSQDLIEYSVRDVTFSSTQLDYCIVRMKPENMILASLPSSTIPGRCCSCHVLALSGVASSASNRLITAYVGQRQTHSGTLSGTPTFQTLPGGRVTQEFWTVNLRGTLFDGDCGSIVVDRYGKLQGHIVAGDKKTGNALIVPAHQVMADIRQKYDENIALVENPQNCTPVTLQRVAIQTLAADCRRNLSDRRLAILAQRRRTRRPESPPNSELGPPPCYWEVFQKLPNIPFQPEPVASSKGQRFRTLLKSLSHTPHQWENPDLLDDALQVVPLARLYDEAEAQSQSEINHPHPKGDSNELKWGYQDYVIQALMRWFRTDFFSWVNNPKCSTCGSPTLATGMTPPLPDEITRGANRVELYQCSSGTCRLFERFPRYADPFVLLQTRRGRVGEWTNCFSMLCRALGSRVRWVWSDQDLVWTEVYSTHCQRWIHVDCCEGLWDRPRCYTEGWKKKLAYCIAFSTDRAIDVTRRYVPDVRHLLPRERATTSELLHILNEINNERRASLTEAERARLREEDAREEQELRQTVVEFLVKRICAIKIGARQDGYGGEGSTTESQKAAEAAGRDWRGRVARETQR